MLLPNINRSEVFDYIEYIKYKNKDKVDQLKLIEAIIWLNINNFYNY